MPVSPAAPMITHDHNAAASFAAGRAGDDPGFAQWQHDGHVYSDFAWKAGSRHFVYFGSGKRVDQRDGLAARHSRHSGKPAARNNSISYCEPRRYEHRARDHRDADAEFSRV